MVNNFKTEKKSIYSMSHIPCFMRRGFTIVEMIVVMALFMFVIGAGISVFVSMISDQKKVLSEQQLLNQVSYAKEYISKALRAAKTDLSGNCLFDGGGYIYLLTHYDDVSGYYKGIKFINQSNDDICQEFFLDGNGTSENPYILKEIKNGGEPVALISDNFKINDIKFSVNGGDGTRSGTPTYNDGSGCTDIEPCGAYECSDELCVQPKVTTILSVQISDNQPEKIFQTTVSQRNLNAR